MIRIIPYIVLASVTPNYQGSALYSAQASINFEELVGIIDSDINISISTVLSGDFLFDRDGYWEFNCNNVNMSYSISDWCDFSNVYTPLVFEGMPEDNIFNFNYRNYYEPNYFNIEVICSDTGVMEVLFKTFNTATLYASVDTQDNLMLNSVVSFGFTEDTTYFSNAFSTAINQAALIYGTDSPAYNLGVSEGVNIGYSNGYSEGVHDGRQTGYATGYADGLQEGMNTDQTAFTIFNGILAVGMLPINFFLSIFNFEILGLNLMAMVSALLSVGLVIYIVRKFMGGS